MLFRGLVRISRILIARRALAHPQVTMKRSTLTSSFIYFSLCCAVHAALSAEAGCDKSRCPGPLAYYNALNCTPVYATDDTDSCCAHKYNCQHLQDRSTDKCYRNGHEYELGEKLRKKDKNPCRFGCYCTRGHDGVASFTCATVRCFLGPVTPGGYRQNSPDQCCPGQEICPDDPSDVATCEVDGETYRDGEYFAVKDDSDLNCVCSAGYTGQNVLPWCMRPNARHCSPDFHHASDIHFNCAPVYYSNQNPATDCSVFSRCQNKDDKIIKAKSDATASYPDDADSDDECNFGNMTMSRGDELNMGTDSSSVCVKCVCEVPPLPTCQRLPDEECDVTKHPVSDNFN